MRRAVLVLLGTVAGLALLLSYRTAPGSASRQLATAPATSSTVPARFGGLPVATAPPPPGLATTEAPPTTSAVTRGPTTTTTSTMPPASTGTAPSGTFTGPVVVTRYGPVQVEVTLVSGRLTDVQADELPVDRSRSAAISQRAAPILRSEALAAQGARIDSVSGASYTSRAYAQSLQAALDAARG
jgi:uncharacterized protein with FMN-binding domain